MLNCILKCFHFNPSILLACRLYNNKLNIPLAYMLAEAALDSSYIAHRPNFMSINHNNKCITYFIEMDVNIYVIV